MMLDFPFNPLQRASRGCVLRLPLLSLSLLAALCAGSPACALDDAMLTVVPVVTIYPGQVVSNDMLAESQKQISQNRLFALTRGEIVGKQTRYTLLPGNFIPKNALVEPNVMLNGKLITMRYAQGGLDISCVGLAMQSASTGEMARARNVDSGIIVTGTVMSDGSLRLSEP